MVLRGPAIHPVWALVTRVVSLCVMHELCGTVVGQKFATGYWGGGILVSGATPLPKPGARGTLRPKMGLRQDAFWSQLAPYGFVFRSGGGVLTVLPPRVFSRGQNLPQSFPKSYTFRRSTLSKIIPKRSTLHSPKLFLLPSRVACPQRICMPSRDLYALKGFVCPQGICMSSKDLGPLARPMGPKTLEDIQIP